MQIKHIEVIGGEDVVGEDKEGNPLPPVFTRLRRRDPARKGQELREVVREDRLAALFRQDWELASAPKIIYRETTSPTTVPRLDW